MDNKDKITINKYISGELNDTELESVEQRLQNEQALADEVNFHKLVNDTLAKHYQATTSIDKKERIQFKQTLNEIMNRPISEDFGNTSTIDQTKRMEFEHILDEVMKSEPVRPVSPTAIIFKRLVPVITGIAAVLIGVLVLFSTKNQNPADEYFEPYEYNRPATLSLGDENFEKVNVYLQDTGLDSDSEGYTYLENTIPKLNTENLQEQIVKGNIEYKLEKYNDAIKTFNEVIEKTGDAALKNTANWYLALIYIKKDNPNQATKLLKQLPETADFYSQAQDLIKALK